MRSIVLNSVGNGACSTNPLAAPWLAISLLLYFAVAALGLFAYTPILRQQIQILHTQNSDSKRYRSKAPPMPPIGCCDWCLTVVNKYNEGS